MVFFDQSRLVSVVVALLAFIQTCAGNSCETGWKEHSGKCYGIFPTMFSTWGGAENACKRAGAHLVVFESQAEEQWVNKTARPIFETARKAAGKSHSFFWIGLNDIYTEGTFIWVNGKSLLSTGFFHGNSVQIASFANYRVNGSIVDLDNSGSFGEHCFNSLMSYNSVITDGYWADVPCVFTDGYHYTGSVCEKDLDECLDPNLCSSQAVCFNSVGSYKCICNTGYTGDGHVCTPLGNRCQPKWAEYKGKCYGVFSMESEAKKSWDDAKNLCSLKSAELVRYETRDEDDFVIFRSGLQFLRYPYKNHRRFFYWIGLKKVGSVYQWSNGKTPADYQYQRYLRREKPGWVWSAAKTCTFASHAMDVFSHHNFKFEYYGAWDTDYCPENHLTNASYYFGYVCERDLDECSVSACSANASCTNFDGGFTCTCKTGYTGNGTVCADVDECLNVQCPTNSLCVNTNGSFSCQCYPGYQSAGGSCTDIDECASRSHTCSPDAQCTNTNSSYQCTCKTGFAGNGNICTDFDECRSTSHACSPDAQCTNTNSSYQCTCKTGFTGNGTTCTDNDECDLGVHDCSASSYQQCVNTPSSFHCICKPGYTGNGAACTDMNECSLGLHDCPPSSNCNNTIGFYFCQSVNYVTVRSNSSTGTNGDASKNAGNAEKASASSDVGGIAAGVFFAGLLLGVCAGFGTHYTMVKRQPQKTDRSFSSHRLTLSKHRESLDDSDLDFDIYARPSDISGSTSSYIKQDRITAVNKYQRRSDLKMADLTEPDKLATRKAKGNDYHKAGSCDLAISPDNQSDVYEADIVCTKPTKRTVYQNTPASAGPALPARSPQPLTAVSTLGTLQAVDDGELYGNEVQDVTAGQKSGGKAAGELYGNADADCEPAQENGGTATPALYGNADDGVKPGQGSAAAEAARLYGNEEADADPAQRCSSKAGYENVGKQSNMVNGGEKSLAVDDIYEAIPGDQISAPEKSQDAGDDLYMVDNASGSKPQ